MGSKHHTTTLIKNLEKQLATTTDPKLQAQLSGQLTKLLTQPKKRGPRKSAEVPSVSTKPGRLAKRTVTGSMVDQLSDGEWLVHDMVLSAEKLRKEQRAKLGRDLTEAEEAAITAEVYATLSDEERAMGEGC